jgi:hypothetical protein
LSNCTGSKHQADGGRHKQAIVYVPLLGRLDERKITRWGSMLFQLSGNPLWRSDRGDRNFWKFGNERQRKGFKPQGSIRTNQERNP